MCITIGPALLLLSFTEKNKNGFTNIMVVFGPTAFFYYILHLYLIHLLAAILFFIKGKHTVQFVLNYIHSCHLCLLYLARVLALVWFICYGSVRSWHSIPYANGTIDTKPAIKKNGG